MSANHFFAALFLYGTLSSVASAGQPALQSVVELDQVSNAVTETRDGTVFAGFPRVTGAPGLRVAKIVNGKPVAFLDDGWNAWKWGASWPQRDGEHHRLDQRAGSFAVCRGQARTGLARAPRGRRSAIACGLRCRSRRPSKPPPISTARLGPVPALTIVPPHVA